MALFCRRSWFNARVGWSLAVLTALTVGCSFVLAQTGGTDSPLPIQRILITPERAAKELEKVQSGSLIRLPRQEFEDRVARVLQTQKTRQQKPHLTRAHYSAEFVDRSFSDGSGKWTIRHTGTAASILGVDPLNLALAKLRWEQGGDAVMAELAGKSLGLLVSPTAGATFLFDWSARGAVTQEGIAFSLTVPPCPHCTFDLTLPIDSWLTVLKTGAIVTGPHEMNSSSKRLWKVQVTGSKPVEILVRKVAATSSTAATVFARLHSVQYISPDRLAADHEFQLDILHGSVNKLILEGDGGLQPYAVLLPSGETKSWQWKDNTAKNDSKGQAGSESPGLLTIDFPEPVQGKIPSLRVRSLVARTAAGLWTSPRLRVRDALSRGETLEVRMHPDLAFGAWDHGSFQLVNVATEIDGAQKLTLAEIAGDASMARRPTLVAALKGIDLHTTESHWWHITQRGALLTSEIDYAPSRGSLFELRVKLPKTQPSYQIETLELQPPEMLGRWHQDGDFLVVELKQPLTPAKKASLKIHLRSGFRDIPAGIRTLGYPELDPIDSTKREGTLAIFVDPIFRVQLMNPATVLAPDDAAGHDKMPLAPSYRFVFRDKRPTPVVRLTPQPAQVLLHGAHTITLSEKHAALQFRWEAQPLVGNPEFLDFRLAPGFPSAWNVNGPADTLKIHHWERLPLQEVLPHLLEFGSSHGVQAATLASSLPRGTFWRFYLSEALEKKSTFTLEAASPAGIALPNVKIWSVPLMTPAQQSNLEQQFTVKSPNEPIGSVVVGAGVTPMPSAVERQLDRPVSQLRLHENGDGPLAHLPQITLGTHPLARSASSREMCDDARQATYVYKDGRIYHRIQFRLWHWGERTCELRLPSGSQVVAANLLDRALHRLEADEAQGQVRLTLPVDQNAAYVSYDILVRAAPQGNLMPGLTRIEIPRIGWPMPPLDVQTRVFLENGWMPLFDHALTRIGVPAKVASRTETPRRLRQLWNAGQTWQPFGTKAAILDKLENQRQIVLRAEAQMRAGAGESLKLSETLERFALYHLKDQAPLLIDAVAMHSLGLTPETTFSPSAQPFWETLGLVYVPCPSGALLTSPRRLKSIGSADPWETAELDDAVREAVLHGRDASAAFYLIVTWLKLPAADTAAHARTLRFPAWERLDEIPEMSEWELLTAGAEPAGFFVIDSTLARALGWMLASGIALVLWRMQRAVKPFASFRLLVVLLTASVLTVIWSSLSVREFFALPALFVVIIGLLWCVIRIISRRATPALERSTVSHPKATAAVLGLLLLSISWNAAAQSANPRTYIVFIIDEPKQAVLVAPDLIAKLDELEKQPVLLSVDAVLVSARYEGKVNHITATFDAQYEIYSLQEQANLLIPLSGVQLREGAFLDGAPVYPAPHKNGYVLPIRGKGAHRLSLSFTDRGTLENDQISLGFTIPKLAQSDIIMHWQLPVKGFHCKHSCGEEKIVAGPNQSVKEWRAQLGYESVVNLRWSPASAGPALKAIEVRETHFWDLRPASRSLATSMNYAIGTDIASQLFVALPEKLHVRAVEAMTTPTFPALGVPIVVKNWSIFGKEDQRRLVVEFAQAVTGNITLNLDIVPQAVTQQSDLRLLLPAPVQAKVISSLLGYRLDATELKAQSPNIALQAINAEEFEQLWKKQSTQPLPSLSRAYRFQRKTSTAAWLELTTQPTTWQARGQLLWNLDQHHADLHGTFTISSAREDLMLLEFFIDKSITLTDVDGPDVRRWNLSQSQLQIWLRQPRKETTLKLTGWRSQLPKGGTPTEKTFALPPVYPRQAQASAVTVEVVPAPGIHLRQKHLQNLRPSAARTLHYAIEKVPYEATFAWTAETKPPEALMLTKVNRTEQGMAVWHGVRLRTVRGQLPTLKVHLKDWQHGPLTLDAPGAIVQPLANKSIKHPVWTLQYPAGLPREVFITLSGRVGNDPNAAVAIPMVELEDADVRRRWLAWSDVEIVHAESGKQLAHDKSVKSALTPHDHETWLKDIPTWNLAEAGSSLQAVLPKTAPRSNAGIVASSEATRRGDQGRWLHEASYWVFAPEATELRVKFPAPVEGLRVWTDRKLQAAFDAVAQDFVLTLDASPQPRRVELQWKYSASAEPTEAPTLAAVRIDQLPLPAHQRIVWVPFGMIAAHTPAEPVPSLLARRLHEAQGQMLVAASLAAHAPELTPETTRIIAARQLDFYACIGEAEYALAILKSVQPDLNQARWRDRMDELVRKNLELAKEHRYHEQQQAAHKASHVTLVSRVREDRSPSGIPLLVEPSWPGILLQPDHDRSDSVQRTHSELMLLAAIFLMVFSYVRHGWAIVRGAAPEVAMALTAAAMGLYGFSLIGVVLIGSMVVLRSLWLAAAVREHFGRSLPVEDAAKQPTEVPPPHVPS